MELINKNNSNITYEELERLYEIHFNNLTVEENRVVTSNDNYKEQWINEIKNNPQLLCSMFFDNNVLIGYIIIFLNSDENYIRDFEIVKDYQSNGHTFKEMVKMVLPYTNKDKLYTGRILPFNEHAKSVFIRIGALINDGKYVCPYNRLIKVIDMDKEELNKKLPPKHKKGYPKSKK